MTGLVLTALAAACTVLTLLPLLAIVIYGVSQGCHRLDAALVTQLPPAAGLEGGGIGNAILGTLMVIGMATLIAAPVGILRVYLSELAGDTPLTRWIRRAARILSGVPSIITGMVAYGVLVVTGVLGFSAMAGVALAILMLPTLVLTTDAALQGVPQDLRWAAASLGASEAQTVLQIVLPQALPGIVTGLLLAIARAAGETAPVLFTALNSSLWPQGWLEPTPTLAVLIYDFSTSPFPAQQELAWAAALMLITLVFITNLLLRWGCIGVDPDIGLGN
ncbi:phosphate transporter permease subunit PtsA [Halomicronema hongdechloris C2206]|uniref:Phosphate transport system permease protein PstA n=1 Tax=Halomicronema hongdechloris C2206 TaxID=1641165 RepID=A0A1Z3HJE7_9CYAN|nr:phosphate ABC transporter permease PstA [Halomicronema hongdechloris]ASC70413.1 phosphate transporter permease subunit PtsA [Halomicronema hongdechloris C2206]